METTVFRVEGMTCGGCEGTVRTVVGRVEGVDGAQADHRDGTVTVTFDPARTDLSAVRRAIEDAGYDLVTA